MIDRDEIRTLLEVGHLSPPFTIHTAGGKSYPVKHEANIWFPPGLTGMVAVAVPGRCLAVLRLEMIDGVTCDEVQAP